MGVRYRFNQDVLPKGRTYGKRDPAQYRQEATKINRLGNSELVVKAHADAEPGSDTHDSHTQEGRRQASSSNQYGDFLDSTATSVSETYDDLVPATNREFRLITEAVDVKTIPTAVADVLNPWERYFLLYCESRHHLTTSPTDLRSLREDSSIDGGYR